jgi:hypothetical protein
MKKNSIAKIWENKKSILEGIKNNIFKQEHIEQLAAERYEICAKCDVIDLDGKECVAPGTQPCCGNCGCSLKLKLRVPHEKCPLNKWMASSTLEESFQILDIVNNNKEKK